MASKYPKKGSVQKRPNMEHSTQAFEASKKNQEASMQACYEDWNSMASGPQPLKIMQVMHTTQSHTWGQQAKMQRDYAIHAKIDPNN